MKIAFEQEVEAVRAALRIGPIRIRVRGQSMSPILRSGDRVLVEGVRSPVEVGQLLVFARDGWVVHRVVAIRGETIWARGDACFKSDAPWTADEVVGHVIARVRAGGSPPTPLRTPGPGRRFLQRASALLTRALSGR